MKRLILGFIFIILFININCTVFNDCGSLTGSVDNITVTGCTSSDQRCHLKRGTNATLNASFTSKTNSNSATVKVWGVISGVPLPFSIPSDGCQYWNIQCPLTSGGIYDLKLNIPVSVSYPRVQCQVRVAVLDDSGSKLICQQFPVQLE